VVERLRLLKEVTAAIRFLSIEPLLGEVVFGGEDLKGIDWVIEEEKVVMKLASTSIAPASWNG
jgi:protein gp37